MASPTNKRSPSAGALDPKLVRFLSDAKSYPHRPRRVEMIQTHASCIFLAGPFVYKVKKPVNFGFLDFSTLDKRRFFCQRELDLNRRLSPEVYLDVVPVCSKGKTLSLGGAGEPVEFAVRMRKLSSPHFLHRLVDRGKINKRDLSRVAALLSRFYQQHEPTGEIERWGRIEMLRISTDENFTQTEKFVGKTISRVAFETLRAHTSRFYSRHRALFTSRIREKRIRDCHGDLHLEHIHLTTRAIQIFDCIEFNDRLRYIDVANDLAFLAMDLDFHHRPDLASYFVQEMARELRDRGLVRLMNFYKSYRAYVRGKVESLNSMSADTPVPQREASEQRARRYFHLALQYAVSGSKPTVLVVMGRIASGKSTLANALAGEFGWNCYSSDRIRKELAGLPAHGRTSPLLRRNIYRKAMTRRVYRMLASHAVRALGTAHGVIVDATFSRREQRETFRRAVARIGATISFIEAVAPRAHLKDRLRHRDENAISDARIEDFDSINQRYEPPVEIDARQRVRISTEGKAAEVHSTAIQKLVEANLRFENGRRPHR